MRIISYIVLFCIILLGLSFAYLNADAVTINYYVATAQMPLSILLAFAFVAGGITGLFVAFSVYIKLKREQYRLRQRIKIAEKEVENLRVIPLKDEH